MDSRGFYIGLFHHVDRLSKHQMPVSLGRAKRKNLHFIFLLWSWLIALHTGAIASISSSHGVIDFDINGDSISEMSLSSKGLGIGTSAPQGNLHVSGNAIITQSLAIGNNSSNANLHIGGSLAFSSQSTNTHLSLDQHGIVFADTSTNSLTLTLPLASSAIGRTYIIKKTSTLNELQVQGQNESIDEFNTFKFPTGDMGSLEVLSTGSQWLSISTYGNVKGYWTPSLISTRSWYDASDSSSISSGPSGNVYQWNDKSGNNYHLTQSGASAQPTTGSRTRNSLNAIDFNGSQYFSISNGPQPSDNNTMIMAVVDLDTVNLTRIYNGQVGNATRFTLSFESNAKIQFNHNSIWKEVKASSGTATGPRLIGGYRENTYCSVGTDGQYLTLNSRGASLPSLDRWYVGCYIGSSGLQQVMDGAICELIIVDQYSLENRQKIEGYLAHKWGLSSQLPSDHPYKSQGP